MRRKNNRKIARIIHNINDPQIPIDLFDYITRYYGPLGTIFNMAKPIFVKWFLKLKKEEQLKVGRKLMEHDKKKEEYRKSIGQ